MERGQLQVTKASIGCYLQEGQQQREAGEIEPGKVVADDLSRAEILMKPIPLQQDCRWPGSVASARLKNLHS